MSVEAERCHPAFFSAGDQRLVPIVQDRAARCRARPTTVELQPR